MLQNYYETSLANNTCLTFVLHTSHGDACSNVLDRLQLKPNQEYIQSRSFRFTILATLMACLVQKCLTKKSYHENKTQLGEHAS